MCEVGTTAANKEEWEGEREKERGIDRLRRDGRCHATSYKEC